MAAPERFAEKLDSSCTAGTVHTWPIATASLRMADGRFRCKAEMALSSLPCAASHRLGRSRRTTMPASSTATRTDRRSVLSISRTSPVGARRRSCSPGTRPAAWPRTPPEPIESNSAYPRLFAAGRCHCLARRARRLCGGLCRGRRWRLNRRCRCRWTRLYGVRRRSNAAGLSFSFRWRLAL